MRLILALDTLFSRIAWLCGALSAGAMILLLINVFYDVVMRYGFNDVSIGMQELEWHLFSCVFLLGIPYAIQQNAHVRVDILYDRWSDQTKAWINLFGTLILILPFIFLVAYFSYEFAYESYDMGEGSGDPGGLSHRWIIKALIPASFILIGLASLSMVTQALRVLIGKEPYPESKEVGLS